MMHGLRKATILLLYCQAVSSAKEPAADINDKTTATTAESSAPQCDSGTIYNYGSTSQPGFCDVFMAPTNRTKTGWGVYANKDFEEGELFDRLPLFVVLDKTGDSNELRISRSTHLNDYVYNVQRTHTGKIQCLVMFGYEMVYNHHSTDPSVTFFLDRDGYGQGFVAKRSVTAGEQLFSSYNPKTGGKEWFQQRNLEMHGEKDDIVDQQQLEYLSSRYCSKISAGPSDSSPLLPKTRPSRNMKSCHEVEDTGLFKARAMVAMQAGDIIEQGPALLLYKPFVQDTAMGALVLSWVDLSPRHQQVLRRSALPLGGKLPIVYQGPASEMQRVYRLTTLDYVTILPFAGRLGMVRRGAGNEMANCRLDIEVRVDHSNGKVHNDANVSVVLTLIATRDIPRGETLIIEDVKPSGTPLERQLLKEKLLETGHDFDLES